MKTSRIPGKPRPTRETFGLFVVIESKRVMLPLKGVECDFSVVSGLAEVSMTQIFRQDNEKALNCEYLFPLPADASVYFCEADINGRTIRAQVRERQEARQITAEKKAAGFRTALVEAERQNLFTLSLGNLQPGDLVIIQLKYFQTLRYLAGAPSIEIPFCPGIRYIPGAPFVRSNKGKGVIDDTDEVPDASRITPVRIDAEHPDAAYVEVRGTLDGKFVHEKDLSSPSHAIVVRPTGEQLRVSLSEKSEVPDRDFVLRWTEKDAEVVTSRAWICEKEKEIYALLEIRAPKEVPSERAPVDFYFLVDRSGSMAGEKWNKAVDALQSCMKVLGPADRAMVTFFESRFQDFAEGPLAVQELLGDRQFQALKQLGAAGGTELRPALEHSLEIAAKHSVNRCKNLILITDAQIGNESAILELMKSTPDFPVHCFGIDVALNDSLLLALCRQQGGTFHSLNPNDDIEQAVTSLGRALGHPVLLDLRLTGPWESADAVIPNLYAGQVHYLSARSCSPWPVELRARAAASKPVKIQFDRQTAAFDVPYLHWSRSRIQRLIAQGHNKAAVDLSIKSNLICPLTAFIAWDESEEVPIASHALIQPVELPARAGAMQFGLADKLVSSSSLYREFQAERGEILKHKWIESEKADRDIGFERAATDWILKHRSKCRKSRQHGQFEVPPSKNVPLDELKLKRELSDLCHKTGVADWQVLVKAIFDWIAEASGAARTQRTEVLNRLLEELKVLAKCFSQSQASREQRALDEARQRIHKLMSEFVDKLPARK